MADRAHSSRGRASPSVVGWRSGLRATFRRERRRLHGGESIAVVTDSGSPGIRDPGYPLVRAAVAEGVRVESIPGPSAVIAALQVSGLPTDAFMFAGFLPVRRVARRRRLEELHE